MVAAEPGDRLTLISGPAGGGKSRWAEHLAAQSGRHVLYLATGPLLPEDPAWQERLRRHRQRRPPAWELREVGGALSDALADLPAQHLCLVDSLGTWVAAHLDRGAEEWERISRELQEVLEAPGGPVLLVVEECGWGVVPASVAGGRFRERLAAIQQRLARRCAASWLVLQGRALDLQQLGQRVPGEA